MPEKPLLKKFCIDGMTCSNCENRIDRKLKRTKGIIEVKVSYTTGTAKICYNAEQIQAQEIVAGLSDQYDVAENVWNTDFIHTIGMYSLYDGYIVKVYDQQNQTIWDAEECDMSLCSQIMNDIHARMLSK